MKFVRRVILTVAPPLLVLGATGPIYASLAHRLPERLATHFGPGGAADGFTTPDHFVSSSSLVLGVLSALLVVFVVLTRTNPRGQRFLVAGSFVLSAMMGLMYGMVALSNLDVTDPTSARAPGWLLPLTLLVAAAAGTMGYLLAGHVPNPERTEPVPHDVPRIALAEEERASWSQAVVTRSTLLAGVVVVVFGVAQTVAFGWESVFVTLPGLILIAASSIRVIVDARGLTLRPSLIPWPRKRIPLSEIMVVHVQDINPRKDFGGWGYRSKGTASGLVVRTGEAIVVELTDNGTFVVTVDDAHTAAALLNTLAERARTLD